MSTNRSPFSSGQGAGGRGYGGRRGNRSGRGRWRGCWGSGRHGRSGRRRPGYGLFRRCGSIVHGGLTTRGQHNGRDEQGQRDRGRPWRGSTAVRRLGSWVESVDGSHHSGGLAWPKSDHPQQTTLLSCRRPQVWMSPLLMATNRSPSGGDDWASFRCPNRQVRAVVSSAQVWYSPLLIDTPDARPPAATTGPAVIAPAHRCAVVSSARTCGRYGHADGRELFAFRRRRLAIVVRRVGSPQQARGTVTTARRYGYSPALTSMSVGIALS